MPEETGAHFGTALRGWRERAEPSGTGIGDAEAGAGTTRRVTGLRRGELAGLAGLSAEYVKRADA